MSMANKLLLLIGLSSVIINLPYISGTRGNCFASPHSTYENVLFITVSNKC